MTDRVDLREFIGGFVAEADELVASAHALLVELDAAERTGAARPRAVTDLYRALHTVKGLAGMVGVEPIVEIAHALETLVRAADKSGGRLRRDVIELAVQAVQAIGERVRAVAGDRTPEPAPPSLLTALAAADLGPGAPPVPAALAPAWDDRLTSSERQQLFAALREGLRAWTITFTPTEDTAARGVTIAAVRARFGELGALVKVVPRALGGDRRGVVFDLLLVSDASPAAIADAGASMASVAVPVATPPDVIPAEETAPASSPAPSPAGTEEAGVVALGRAVVRVDLARLDDLQEQLSLLITSRLRLVREIAALADRGVDVARLRELADLQARQLRELRRAILRVRMVRVAEVLEPLALLVRSLTRPGVKEVRLELDARDTEVDKAVADRLLPALIHMVRNAVDHAIETVDERLAAGKDRAGTLRVACASLGSNQLELVISDDGRGIDRAAVGRRAHRAVDTDEDLLDVLTTAGFSTRDIATLTSGRGLGMDIVKRVVTAELGGSLALATTPGRGTTFTLRLPLTIAVVDVLSFACGPQAFVVPVSAVEEIFELAGDERQPPAPAGGAAPVRLLERRGHALPVVSLGALLSIDGGAAARKALVIRQGGKLLAFAVDRMLGRQEVVVRQLADPLLHAPGIAGATDLGDGRPTVVLDLFALGERLTVSSARAR